VRTTVDTARRHAEALADRAWARAGRRFRRRPRVEPFDGSPRVALVSVNASTTQYLKLMLCTLAEQSRLGLVHQLVIVDNRSRDGGAGFLRLLAARVDRARVVEHRAFLNHARGMRAGVRALDRAERGLAQHQRANVVLFCDPDVVFRSVDALADLATSIAAHDAALAGEIRSGPNPRPDIQASFLAVRRDVYARRDVAPLESGGSPAYRMQQAIVDLGLTVIDFPSNRGGHILHRGRSAVAASAAFTPRRSYASVASTAPHFMGVPDGDRIWAEIEARHAALLPPAAEPALVEHLSGRFTRFGDPTDDIR
jgi:hypothetical protein